MKKKDYISKPALAVYATSAFTGLEIVELSDSLVVVREYTDTNDGMQYEIHKYMLYLDTRGYYFNFRDSKRYHLDLFQKV